MERLSEIMKILSEHERVSNIYIHRSEIKRLNDEGWIESDLADESFVSFTIDHSNYLRPKRTSERGAD